MSIPTYSSVATDNAGNVINGAQITVYVAGTTVLATLYEPDDSGPKSNPFVSGDLRAEGEVEFGVQNGLYNIKVDNGGDIEWRYNQGIYDPLSGLVSDYYVDSGTPNNYILTGGDLGQSGEYIFQDGLIVRFVAANTSTGAACSIELNGAAARTIVTIGGNQLPKLAIKQGHEVVARYDLANDRFVGVTLYHPSVTVRGINDATSSTIPTGVLSVAPIDEIIEGDAELFDALTHTFSLPGTAIVQCNASVNWASGGTDVRYISIGRAARLRGLEYQNATGGFFYHSTSSGSWLIAGDIKLLVLQNTGSDKDLGKDALNIGASMTVIRWI